MKLLWSLIVTVIVLGFAVPAVLKRIGPDKDAESNLTDSWLKGSSAVDEDSDVEEQAVRSGTLYRWKDANGTLHIESKPPPSGVEYETIGYTTKVEHPVAESTVETTPSDTTGRLPDSPLSVYTTGGITELMERANKTAKRIDERDQLLNELEKKL